MATDDPGVLAQPGGNLALDLFVLDQHLGRLLDAALAPTGVTASLYAVYSQLARGPQTPGEVSAVLGVRPTTLSGHLAAIERAGHLTRSRHERDGRSRLLELTPEGHAQVAACRPVLADVVAAVQTALGGPGEVTAARAMLARIDAALLAVLEERTP